MKVSTHGISDIGPFRENNEDCFFIDPDNRFFIVADGLGGHAAGEVASRLAVTTVQACLTGLSRFSLTRLEQAVLAANREVIDTARQHPGWRGMGTTLTLLAVEERQASLAHVGDSRLYLLRDHTLSQLSEDHTLAAEQKSHAGTLDPGIFANLGNILTQAIGLTEALDICLKQFCLSEKDRLLLCSDGLSNMLRDSEIAELLAENAPRQACSALLSAALEAGGRDNITIIVIQVCSEE